MDSSELILQRPPRRVNSEAARRSTPPQIRRYLREISAHTREDPESENPAVTKLALQLLAKMPPTLIHSSPCAVPRNDADGARGAG